VDLEENTSKTQKFEQSLYKSSALTQPYRLGNAQKSTKIGHQAPTVKEIKSKWKNTIMHGQYIHILDVQIINKKDTHFLGLLSYSLMGKLKTR